MVPIKKRKKAICYKNSMINKKIYLKKAFIQSKKRRGSCKIIKKKKNIL